MPPAPSTPTPPIADRAIKQPKPPRAAAAAPPEPKAITLRVSTANGIESRIRAGIEFGRDPKVVVVTAEQADRIKRDDVRKGGGLIVSEVGDGATDDLRDEVGALVERAERAEARADRAEQNLSAALAKLDELGVSITTDAGGEAPLEFGVADGASVPGRRASGTVRDGERRPGERREALTEPRPTPDRLAEGAPAAAGDKPKA